MKRLPLILSFILFIALSSSLAYWGAQLFKPAARPAAAPPRTAPAEIRTESAAALFGGRKSEAAVATAANFQLQGVIFSGNPRTGVAILTAEGKPAQAVRASKEVAPGVTVQEVHRRHVVISDNGVSKRIELPDSTKERLSVAGAAPLGTASATGPVRASGPAPAPATQPPPPPPPAAVPPTSPPPPGPDPATAAGAPSSPVPGYIPNRSAAAAPPAQPAQPNISAEPGQPAGQAAGAAQIPGNPQPGAVGQWAGGTGNPPGMQSSGGQSYSDNNLVPQNPQGPGPAGTVAPPVQRGAMMQRFGAAGQLPGAQQPGSQQPGTQQGAQPGMQQPGNAMNQQPGPVRRY